MSSDNRLAEAGRLRAIEEILAANGREDWEFDRHTRLAKAMLGVPVCLVSLVTSDRQVFAGACGLPQFLDEVRETPLSHSICQHAVTRRSMLVISDTLLEPEIATILSVREYGIRAYLGCPLMTGDGHVLGSFCVIDYVPREWTLPEIDHIREFAALVVQKIEGRMNEARQGNAFDLVIHDLKSPLSGIMMASALLMEQGDQLPDRLRPLLDAIDEEAVKALRLVEVLAKETHQEAVGACDDVRKLAAAMVARWRPMAEAKQISLEFDYNACPALAVHPWVIEQILENLLGNAVKYSPVGGAILLRVQAAGRIGHFTVADEGPGFSAEDRKSIFKRYTRLSAQPTGGEMSTGLGLSIVKRLIDQHNGNIELLSPVGQGAEFRFSFPQRTDISGNET